MEYSDFVFRIKKNLHPWSKIEDPLIQLAEFCVHHTFVIVCDTYFCQAQQTMFCRDISGFIWTSHQTMNRGNIYNSTPS